jgi:nicotinate-nucleotide pyrophosphorylase (carboxylating)
VNLPEPDSGVVARIVAAALEEDLDEAGDITSRAVLAEGRTGTGRIVARSGLVVAGLGVAAEVFRQRDPSLEWVAVHADGDEVRGGELLASVSGRVVPILEGERTALNFLMRMCGIATAARAAVREVEGTGAGILDTRKTAPGLRVLDKYAVAAGGARNHRMGLHDAAMIKDTHLGEAGSVGDAVARVLADGCPAAAVTAEVRNAGELREAMDAGAGRALLDNMGLEELRECVRVGKGRIVLEASGGLRPGNLAEVAGTGVDFLSLGYLTHSAPAGDVAMETTFDDP